MRTVVKEQLAAGKSAQDVKDYFISKYGEWILLEPQAHGFNLLIYAVDADSPHHRAARRWLERTLSTATEVGYVIDHSDAVVVVAEDQEQVDKILDMKEQLPKVRYIIYSDPRGMRGYKQPFLIDFKEVENFGRELEQLLHVLDAHDAQVLAGGEDLERALVEFRRQDHLGVRRGDRLRGRLVAGLVEGDRAAERRHAVGHVGAVVGVDQRPADGHAGGVVVLHDRAGGAIAEVAQDVQRAVDVCDIRLAGMLSRLEKFDIGRQVTARLDLLVLRVYFMLLKTVVTCGVAVHLQLCLIGTQ